MVALVSRSPRHPRFLHAVREGLLVRMVTPDGNSGRSRCSRSSPDESFVSLFFAALFTPHRVLRTKHRNKHVTPNRLSRIHVADTNGSNHPE